MGLLIFHPTLLGFTFFIGKKEAIIVDEDECRVWYQVGQQVRWMNKPVFYARIGKKKDGKNYLFYKY